MKTILFVFKLRHIQYTGHVFIFTRWQQSHTFYFSVLLSNVHDAVNRKQLDLPFSNFYFGNDWIFLVVCRLNEHGHNWIHIVFYPICFIQWIGIWFFERFDDKLSSISNQSIKTRHFFSQYKKPDHLGYFIIK